MNSRNDRIRDFLGVTAWHKAGYTGKRGLTASGEDFINRPNEHPGETLAAFKEIAPDREVIRLYTIGRDAVFLPVLANGVRAKNVDTMFMSYDIPVNSNKVPFWDETLGDVADIFTPFAAMGNDDDNSYNTITRANLVHGVGAIYIDSFGNISAEGYSSASKYADFCAPTGLYVKNTMFTGTSCSTPVLCGMAALVNDFFIDKTGAPLSNAMMYQFLKDNAVDIYAPGHDIKTGWGYVVLQPPDTIDISKYANMEDAPMIAGKTADGLCRYAIAQLGRPYWYGTFGQTATAALYTAKKAQLPGFYTASDFPSQYGQRVHDCAGLIEGYLFSDTSDSPPKYLAAYDTSADGLYNLAKEKGVISTLPNTPGILVHYKDHVGIYIGDGEVVEARGHAYGVVKTRLLDRPWKNWSKCPYISYAAETEDEEMGYNTIADSPEWARPTLEKLISLGALKGDGEGLNLSEDMIRLLVINDRMGVYGK